MGIQYVLIVKGLLKKNNRILILKRHPNSKGNPNCWELPGGKVESGENFDKALIREFKEETNLNIKINDLIDVNQEKNPQRIYIAIIMNVSIASGYIKISDEHIDWKWISIDEIQNLEISGWLKTLVNEKNLKYSSL